METSFLFPPMAFLIPFMIALPTYVKIDRISKRFHRNNLKHVLKHIFRYELKNLSFKSGPTERIHLISCNLKQKPMSGETLPLSLSYF